MTGPIDSLDLGRTNVGTIRGSWDVSYPHAFLVGGRGFGKNAAAAHWRKQMAAVEAMFPSLAPAQVIGNLDVRWSCPKPTDPPPPAVGTYGWYHERAADIHTGRRTYEDVLAEFEAAR
jgi:hypothetical protein